MVKTVIKMRGEKRGNASQCGMVVWSPAKVMSFLKSYKDESSYAAPKERPPVVVLSRRFLYLL